MQCHLTPTTLTGKLGGGAAAAPMALVSALLASAVGKKDKEKL